MTSQWDIYHSARVLLNDHGDSAESEATIRIQRYEAKGNEEGKAVWMRVLAVLRELRRIEPDRIH